MKRPCDDVPSPPKRQGNAAHHDEIDHVSNSGVFADISTKQQANLQERLAAMSEARREAVRQQLTTEAS